MAEIRPFRGIRYNNDQAGDAGSVVSPPYDVIDEKFQQELYDRNENNVVRIILGKDEEGDGPSSNRYTRARDAFQGWLEAGVLVKDEEEGIYLYAQDFEANTSGGPVRKSRLESSHWFGRTPWVRARFFPTNSRCRVPRRIGSS